MAECRARVFRMNRVRRTLIAFVVPALLVFILACASSDDASTDSTPGPIPTPAGGVTSSTQTVPSEAEVVRVIDGVTIEVENDGTRYLVRYLGVSIPVDADVIGALEFNRFMAEGRPVVLSSDDAEVDVDGAHLRYVYIGRRNGESKALERWLGRGCAVSDQLEKFEEFYKVESLARTDGRGIWSMELSAPATEPTTSASEPKPSEPTTPVPTAPQPTVRPTQNFAGGTLPAAPGSPASPGGGPGSVCDYSGSNTPIIKGNVDQKTGERLYHVPDELFYSTTVIETEQGDR
jgi:endonuclease YncB( thermonuclease family)